MSDSAQAWSDRLLTSASLSVAALASEEPADTMPSILVGMPPEQPASSAAAMAQVARESDAFMMLL
ncbi:hypothetical protein D3C72_2123250 [compost metagenome]